MDKTCWTCGHWLIGGSCWKDETIVNTGPNHSCDSWVEEGADGTVTGDILQSLEEDGLISDVESPKRSNRERNNHRKEIDN